MSDMEQTKLALFRELCDQYAAPERILDQFGLQESVRAVLDGSLQKQECRHGCGRWRVRPVDDCAPDYWLCSTANVMHARDVAFPIASLERVCAGEQITEDDFLTDTSKWVLHRVLPDVLERLAVAPGQHREKP